MSQNFIQILQSWFSIAILFAIAVTSSSAQLSGTVYDQDGEPLPFVTVYKEGTSKGTVSNIEGKYELNLESGRHIVIFKFIGYNEERLEIDLDRPKRMDITLKEESIAISEVLITADAEDPAYRVIRQAIKHREEHKTNVEKYEVDLYIKGVVKMLKAPEKILGQEIGDMEGMLDTTGQGIVYLAESQSKVAFHQPELIKEEMYSSIVAEDDGSFNFNRFIGSSFDIYDEYYEFSRSIMSPLADNALLFYKFKMIETKFDAEGRLINRIQVIPKSSVRPMVFGELYIIEDKWNVKELDLSFTGKAIKEPFFDTIQIKQVHLPLEEDNWMVFSQTMGFTLGAFGFKIGGGFTYVFSDYNLNPDFDKSYFDSEEFKMDVSAIRQDSSFWNDARPIKLTEEERANYIKKDSLKRIWNSKEYQDSVDRKNNKFVFGDFLFGYSHANTHKKRYISYSSPLSTYRFNPVEGSNLKIGANYVKIDSAENRRFSISTDVGYGFSDKRFKFETNLNLRTNRKDLERWYLSFGDTYKQFDERGPVLAFLETWANLYFKENEIRLFRKKYGKIGYQKEISNGIFLSSRLEYANRSTLQNNSNYSFRKKDEGYSSNVPSNDSFSQSPFESHNALKFNLDIRFRIGQKYSSFPKFKMRNTSKWPDIWLKYEKGLSLADTDYDRLSIRINKNRINYKLFGYSNFNLEAGTFLRKEKVEFIDFAHFYTNTYLVTTRSRYMRGFKMMPHYSYSTTSDYVMANYEHKLDGYILDLIPLINKLGWSTVISGNALIREDNQNYYELALGINDFKIGAFSLFRIDYVWSYDDSGLLDRGFVIGLSSLFD